MLPLFEYPCCTAGYWFFHQQWYLCLWDAKVDQALEQAMAANKEILLAAQIKAKTNEPTPEDIYKVGTISTILQLLRLPDGTVKVLVEGQRRAQIKDFIQTEEFFFVEAEELPEASSSGVENEALLRTVKMSFDNYVRLNKRIPPEMLLSIASMDDESKLEYPCRSLEQSRLQDKQRLLEEVDPAKRLEELYGYIQSEIEIWGLKRRSPRVDARWKKHRKSTISMSRCRPFKRNSEIEMMVAMSSKARVGQEKENAKGLRSR